MKLKNITNNVTIHINKGKVYSKVIPFKKYDDKIKKIIFEIPDIKTEILNSIVYCYDKDGNVLFRDKYE